MGMKNSTSDCRRTLKTTIRLAKKAYFCEKITENKEDKKKTWKIINELRGKNKHSIKHNL